MTKSSYKDAYRDAKLEFETLQNDRQRAIDDLKVIDARIVQMRRGIIALAALAEEEVDDVALGLTESVRALFNNATKPMTTQDVVTGVAALGFDVTSQKNPGASVAAVLTRLAENKEITKQVKNERTPGGTFRGRNVLAGAAGPGGDRVGAERKNAEGWVSGLYRRL